MANHIPSTVLDLHRFDVVIDARSPAEYDMDHIPGALNCPVLDNEQRHAVGLTYVQSSAFEARRLGGAMVARNIAAHLTTQFQDKPKSWRPMVYCWRGGLRSGAFVSWLRLVGWDAQQLKGGYKAWRTYVIAQIEALSAVLPLRVLCGPTGSAKTRVLHALAQQGEQVLDLERLAGHRGSVLGAVSGIEQPSQKKFETCLFTALADFDLQRTIWVEAESRCIGKLALPNALLQRLRASPVVEITASTQARLAYLLRDYAWLGDDPNALCDKLGMLKGILPNDLLAQWQRWAMARDLPRLFDDLIAKHYDPLYARSQGRHLKRLLYADHVRVDDLSPEGIQALAQRMIALQAEGSERVPAPKGLTPASA